jgi:O-antigen/teichoic acid export membrane protein
MKVLRTFSKVHLLAITDQLVLSAGNFLATIMVARSGNLEELGSYALAISIVVIVWAIQEAMIVNPYVVAAFRSAKHDGALLLIAVLGAGLLAVGFIGLSITFAQVYDLKQLSLFAMLLACLVPTAMLREYARQFEIANLRILRALLVDSCSAALQIGLLFLLASIDQITASRACLVLVVASGISFLGWLVLTWRERARPAMKFALSCARSSWKLGKSFAIVHVAAQFQSYFSHWLLMIFYGAGTTGIYAACCSIISFANPIVLGLGNVLAPRSIAGQRRGHSHLAAQTIGDAVGIGALMAAFSGFIYFLGEDLLRSLYPRAHSNYILLILMLLTIGASFAAIASPAAIAVAAIGRMKIFVVNQLAVTCVSAAIISILLIQFGLVGAACAACAGGLIGAILKWQMFFRPFSILSPTLPSFGTRSAV